MAHQKINARNIAKSYMSDLRLEALQELSVMGVLVPPQSRAMEEEVMPWLMDKIVGFLVEDQSTTQGAQVMVNTGFENAQNRHKSTIQAKYDKIKQDELDRIEAEKQKIIRKEKRREARIKRAKDQELEKFRDQVQRNVIFKGEVLEVLKTNLVEYHGFYTSEKYIGALGGQANQIYYVLDEVMKKYPDGLATYLDKKSKNAEDEYLLKANNPRELLQQEHLTVFLMAYLKDMKNESIDLSIHPLCIKYLDNLECPLDDLS